MEQNVVTTPESAKNIDLADLKRKTQLTGTVLKTALAGALVDVGLEVPGVIHISQLQEEPTNRVEDVVKVGQTVTVWVKRVDAKKKRIDLTMIEPLELEWREITKGLTAKGKVTKTEKYGAFVDIGAERPGLVHISEMTHGYIKSPTDIVKEGDEVEVQVLEVNRRKKQIKLSMKALEEKPEVLVKAVQPAKERPRDKEREKDKDKEKREGDLEKETPVPTAMEMALRQAMERSKSKSPAGKAKGKRKLPGKEDELERILNRTLQHKVRTGR
jgi:small subunit ribosomal protein S1